MGTTDDGTPPSHWCTRQGGIWSIPFVVLLILAGCFLCVAVITGIDTVNHRFVKTWFTQRREIYGFSLLCTVLSMWLVIGQVFAYVTTGQAKKIKCIKNFFPPTIVAAYFREFCSGDKDARAAADQWTKAGQDPTLRKAAAAVLAGKFDDIITDNFGLGVYALPALLFAVIAFIVLFIGYSGGIAYAEVALAHSAPPPPPIKPLGLTLDLVSIAAIFGAYTWIASDAITRNHQWTFHPSDLAWYSLRLIFAIPLGQAIAITWSGDGSNGVGPSTGALLAFVISMFSFERITALLGGAAARFTGTENASPAERDDVVIALPGADENNAHAFDLESISTIQQLIAVDPVRTSIRTGLPFEYVVSLIDAAILWKFIGKEITLLRAFGFPGASDVLNYLDKMAPSSPPPPGITPLAEMFMAIETRAVRINDKSAMTAVGLQNMFDELARDDYAIFIRNMYNTRI